MADHLNGHSQSSIGTLPEGVLPPLASTMKVDFMIDSQAKVLVLHSDDFADALDWLEYDQDTNHVTFVYKSGEMQDLGMVIPAILQEQLLQSKEAYTMHIKSGQKQKPRAVTIMIRNSTFH